MTTSFYSFSSSSCYTNNNGKESFKSFKQENNNGRIKTETTVENDGIRTTKYYDNSNQIQNTGKKKLSKTIK